MSRNEIWSPRSSVRMRLGREGEETGLTAEPLEVENLFVALPRALALEAQAVLDGLTAELAGLEGSNLPPLSVAIDADDWSVNGWARLADDGTAVLSLSLGFALAVEEATLAFLAQEDGLCPPALLIDEDLPRARLHSYVCEETDGAPRYLDYRRLRGRAFTVDDLTTQFPSDLWRLRQQELLFALMLRWAALHELAHAALRHNELLGACYGDAGLGLMEGQAAPAQSRCDPAVWRRFGYDATPDLALDESDLRRICELHADTCALWLSLDLEQASAGQGLFADFERDMADLVEDPEQQFAVFSRDARVYLLTFAAAAAFVLFENARRHEGGGDSHPLPETRIMTLIDQAFYGSPYTQADDRGGFQAAPPAADLWDRDQITPWNRFIQDAIAPVIDDMNFLADVLDLDFALPTFAEHAAEAIPIVRYDEGPYFKPAPEVGASTGTAWWRDVLGRRQAALAGEEPPPALSAGGRELAQLDPYQPHVNYMTEILQARLNGGPVTFAAERQRRAET
jgi:hypothetical protein